MQSIFNLENEKDEIRNELQGWKKCSWDRQTHEQKQYWAEMITGTSSPGEVARLYERHFIGEENCEKSESLSWHKEY